VGDNLRPHKQPGSGPLAKVVKTSYPDLDRVVISDMHGTIFNEGSWEELRKLWVIMKAVNTRKRVLTVPNDIDEGLVRLGAVSGCSPEAVAVAILRKAIAPTSRQRKTKKINEAQLTSKKENLMTNLCSSLKCPHSYASGCNRYSLATLCPLARVEGVSASQYWLSVASATDIEPLKVRLQLEVLNEESSQKLLHGEAKHRKNPPVMSWSDDDLQTPQPLPS